MSPYIHQLPDWPRFRWNREQLADRLALVRHKQGRLLGRMEGLGFQLRQEAALKTLTDDVLKSSEIEGERLDAQQVRSSIARRLGIDIGGLKPADRKVEGVVEMMLDATSNYGRTLTEERLLAWHASLFPAGRSGMKRIRIGEWRGADADPMQVVSGAIGHEGVHFEAPSAARVPKEMRQFLDWFEGNTENDMVERASIAHLWFVTIHPFEDGNGRIARAIADLMLARSEQSSQRFYSMSSQIRQERDDYYDILERTQKGSMDVTSWMDWFLGCLEKAIEGAQTALGAVLNKAEVWKQLANAKLNDRQRAMLNRLLDGFEGKLTTSKWSKLTKCSQDTALRDIQVLLDAGILVRNTSGGRSTNYALAEISALNATGRSKCDKLIM